MKRKFVGTLGAVMLGLVVGCSSEEVAEKPEKPAVEEVEEKEVKVEEPIEAEPVAEDPVSEEPDVSQDAKEQVQLSLLKSTFDGIAEIDFDAEEKNFIITPTGTDFALELIQMLNGTKSHDDWNNLVESTQQVSNQTLELLGEGYAFTFMNPANKDKVILLIQDGTVLYDVFNQ
jgi:hypothetical protein